MSSIFLEAAGRTPNSFSIVPAGVVSLFSFPKPNRFRAQSINPISLPLLEGSPKPHIEIAGMAGYWPKNIFTKYCCPLPVTFGVLLTLVWPSEWLMTVSLISNSPISMDFCVGML